MAAGRAVGARGIGRRAPARGQKSGEGLGRDAWPVQVASVPAYGATGRHDAGTESGGRREMIQWRFRK